MANPKPSKPFQKGTTGNPNGRPKHPEEVREAKKVNRAYVEHVLSQLASSTREDLQVILKDPATPTLKLIVCSILVKAAQTGDQARLNFILDRLVGKVKEEVEVSSHGFKVVIEDYSSKEDK